MRPRPSVRAGALAVILATVASGCSLVGGGRDTYRVTAFFDRAISIFPDSQVRVLGLPAGRVTDVTVVGDRVRIDMAIDADIPLPPDVEAALVPQSLIGERFVQLSPVWREGQPRVPDGHVIERTRIPVEPDQALEALKEFLDTLEPDALGRLIDNASDTLQGNGADLGRALDSLSDLAVTFSEQDDTLLAILEHLDRLSGTLLERESQLAEVLDAFATATQVLADERDDIGALLDGLAGVSEDGLVLVAEHGDRLRTDIETLTRLAAVVDANMPSVRELLDAGPLFVTGLDDAHNPELRATDLRTQFGPLAQQALDPLFAFLGLDVPSICIPLDVACDAGATGSTTAAATRAAGAGPTATPRSTPAPAPRTPDTAPTADAGTTAARPGLPAPPTPGSGPSRPGGARSVLTALGGLVSDAAAQLLGVHR